MRGLLCVPLKTGFELGVGVELEVERGVEVEVEAEVERVVGVDVGEGSCNRICGGSHGWEASQRLKKELELALFLELSYGFPDPVLVFDGVLHRPFALLCIASCSDHQGWPLDRGSSVLLAYVPLSPTTRVLLDAPVSLDALSFGSDLIDVTTEPFSLNCSLQAFFLGFLKEFSRFSSSVHDDFSIRLFTVKQRHMCKIMYNSLPK